MTEGGGFDNENQWLDDKINNDGDDDGVDDNDDDDDEQEVNRTEPSQPGASSTPYHFGEDTEMTILPKEHSGVPDTSYVETPRLGDLTQDYVDSVRDAIKKHFLKVEFG